MEKKQTIITGLEVNNFLRISAVNINPDKTVVELSGKNKSGKSSTLKAIWSILRGKAVPGMPIKEGADKASIKLTLNGGELTATRTFTKKNQKGTIKLVSKDGATYSSPQKIMDDLVGNRCLDPIAFMNGDAKAQFNELKDIVGFNFSGLDESKKQAYEKRTDAGRVVKDLKSRISGLGDVPNDCPKKEVSSSVVLQEIKEAQEKNNTNRDVRMELENHEERLKKGDEYIQELEKKLSSAKNKYSDVEKTTKNLRNEVSKLEDIDVSPLEEKLNSLESENKLARLYQSHSELNSNLKKAEVQKESLTTEIESIEQKKSDILKDAEFPIEGLSVGDGVVLFNDKPLDQASQAEQWVVSTSIAMAGDPSLKVILIREGSLLDEESRKEIYDLAKEKGYQVWIEIVDSSGDIGIVFEDGEIKS